MNRRACVSSASGIKGVYFSAAARKWCAEIRDGSRKIYIGLFESAALAEAAYLGGSIVLHGEFSYTHSQRIGAAAEEIA
jgi:hypothetical protein